MSILNQFPHRCTIRRIVRVKGDLGGSRDTYLNEQTSVLCWEQSASQKEVMEYEKRGVFITRKIYFTTNPGIGERHQILVTEREGVAVSSPTPLKVRTRTEPDGSAGLGVVYKVFCSETTGEET